MAPTQKPSAVSQDGSASISDPPVAQYTLVHEVAFHDSAGTVRRGDDSDQRHWSEALDVEQGRTARSASDSVGLVLR